MTADIIALAKTYEAIVLRSRAIAPWASAPAVEGARSQPNNGVRNSHALTSIPESPEAAAVAAPLLAGGSTVVAKILSPDIVHKSDVGGVRLNLTSERALRAAVCEILAQVRARVPQARIDGVSIHPMILRPKARELIAGIADDPTFGPVIVFGRGGTVVEVINDKALVLPARPRAGARAHGADARIPNPPSLSRRPGGRRDRHRARAGQARATGSRFSVAMRANGYGTPLKSIIAIRDTLPGKY